VTGHAIHADFLSLFNKLHTIMQEPQKSL